MSNRGIAMHASLETIISPKQPARRLRAVEASSPFDAIVFKRENAGKIRAVATNPETYKLLGEKL